MNQKSKMSYWVYESWPLNKAVVHRDDCPFCENGTNKQGASSARNGSWLGPFEKSEDAYTRAETTKRKIRTGCKSCMV